MAGTGGQPSGAHSPAGQLLPPAGQPSDPRLRPPHPGSASGCTGTGSGEAELHTDHTCKDSTCKDLTANGCRAAESCERHNERLREDNRVLLRQVETLSAQKQATEASLRENAEVLQAVQGRFSCVACHEPVFVDSRQVGFICNGLVSPALAARVAADEALQAEEAAFLSASDDGGQRLAGLAQALHQGVHDSMAGGQQQVPSGCAAPAVL
jgi:hypothetical protein